MKNRRVRVSYGRTCQSAPYESIRLDVSIEKDITDDMVMKDEIDALTNGLVVYIKKKIKTILDNE